MQSVVWLDTAVNDLDCIVAFIAKTNPAAATKLAAQLIEDADNLGIFPAHYRRGRVAGTHEFVSHPNYVIIYRHTLHGIEILNIVHSRQPYPN
ncbi:type II toxin-antitoxin system RelE/ParE family toxin [Limnohabitans sp.]|uniref:type II toxin-antitoxin system RelE/ParE family toxin n=1 Tax=Limnohabitans sp. TaxID=1907725 RepID=UPI00286FA456|nr:type II toxin-antitoxin system RelE/ParE family toxin [Limnohabitans sp.]